MDGNQKGHDPEPERNRNWKKYITKSILRIACWNVTSLTNKDQELILEMERHNIDICALSETKKKGKGNDIYGNYIVIYSGKNKEERASSGVGIIVHQKHQNKIVNASYVNDRILHVTMTLNKNKRTHLVSVYAPDTSKPQEAKDEFYYILQHTIDQIPNSDEIIILGDLNARVGDNVIPGIKERFNEEPVNENGNQLIEFCLQNCLRINNTFYDHKPQHKYTFMNTRGQKSTIDYVITNSGIHPKRIHDVRVLSSANLGTDHNLVLMKIAMCLTATKTQQCPQDRVIEKFNTESFEQQSTKHLFQKRLRDCIVENSINCSDTVNEAWTKVLSNILKSAEEAIGKRQIKSSNRRRKYKPWFCEEVKTLSEEKKRSYLSYRQGNITYNEYVVTRNRVNSGISAIKRESWERFSSDMEHDLYGGQKKVWNMLRNLQKPLNEAVSFSKISTSEWETYFKDLYGSNDNNTLELETSLAISGTQHPEINIDEVTKTVTKLKNRKSPGIDQITNEMIKYGGKECWSELCKLYNKIIQQGEVPESWKTSITVPIFKKGDRSLPNNYRGITLLSSVMKLFTKILAMYISSTGIAEEQQGFRQNRSTTDAIFIVRQIAEKAIEFNYPAHMCFVDLTKAFDRIQLKDVIEILRKRNVSQNIISVITSLNTNNTTCIRTDNLISNVVPIADGIRQGDSLSPILFNLVMDEIISSVKSVARGYNMGTEVKIVCYADDAVLISDNEDDLQRLLFNFEKVAGEYNMRISAEKTKSLTISREPLRCKLAVYGEPIEQVMQFNYLGARITSSKDLTAEVRAQANKAARISGCLRQVIWRNKHLSVRGKVRIYKTCVRPILAYGVETRADTTQTTRIINKVEMQALRAINGFTLFDRKRNEDIRSLCEIQDINKWGRTRRKEWQRHVQRMPQASLAKTTMVGRPRSARLPGRPPKRWNECWTSSSTEAT